MNKRLLKNYQSYILLNRIINQSNYEEEMMKKITCVLITALLFAIALVGCGSNSEDVAAIYRPGTYEGEGQGHSGKMLVSVTVSESEIEKIDFIEFNDSDFALDPANKLAEDVIKLNSADVDVIAGATQTSDGVLAAINEALSKALIAGVVQTGGNKSNEVESILLEDREADVVVIGAGGAGLSAAIEANNNGSKVIVLEKMPIIGGNTKFATGGLNAAETVSQEALGIDDSIDLFIEDTLKGGGNINDLELVNILSRESAETVKWLIDMGADLSDVGRMGGASANRTHRPTGGAPVGNHLVDVLYDNATALGVEVLLGSEVVEILGDESGVTGVIVQTSAGSYMISSNAVIIATGGFGADNAVVSHYNPSLKGYGTTNHPGATGDVLTFAKNLNVAYVDMEEIQTHPTVMPSNNYMITEAVRGNGAILINREGRRFVNELGTRAEVSDAQLAQTGASSFLVFDHGIRESLSAIEGYYNKGFLAEGETVEALAETLGMPVDALKETILSYNEYVASGEDELFERQDLPKMLEKGPYYAVEVAPAIHHTMGGVKINTNAEVISESGRVIPGLYAAGEVVGGIHGNNRLGGNALADITVFGRIAGLKASELSR